MTPLVVFSHLRWAFVRQRPQHLMSRLAAWYDIRFIEEPMPCEGTAKLVVRHVAPGVTLLLPQLPVGGSDFGDAQRPLLQSLLAGSAREHALRDALVWLDTPMALPLVDALHPRLLIYDCMDELSAFKGAPPQLQALEEELLERADLVFTGGPALYEARRHRHPKVHCLPSAVDAAHFSPSNLDPADPQAEQAERLQDVLPRPRLGYFGVIDERMDLGLLAGLADARPHWQIVMVGPVARIDPLALPQRPNIHWLGMQPYARLPYLLAGWDLCLMPFALNAATDYISPTKTLEYMAGEKPVVSTPVPDVALLYGSVVRLAHGVEAFVEACDDTLAETPRQRSARVMEMLGTVSTLSWDRTALTVHQLIDAELVATEPAGVEPVLTAPPVLPPPKAVRSPPRAAAGPAVQLAHRVAH